MRRSIGRLGSRYWARSCRRPAGREVNLRLRDRVQGVLRQCEARRLEVARREAGVARRAAVRHAVPQARARQVEPAHLLAEQLAAALVQDRVNRHGRDVHRTRCVVRSDSILVAGTLAQGVDTVECGNRVPRAQVRLGGEQVRLAEAHQDQVLAPVLLVVRGPAVVLVLLERGVTEGVVLAHGGLGGTRFRQTWFEDGISVRLPPRLRATRRSAGGEAVEDPPRLPVRRVAHYHRSAVGAVGAEGGEAAAGARGRRVPVASRCPHTLKARAGVGPVGSPHALEAPVVAGVEHGRVGGGAAGDRVGPALPETAGEQRRPEPAEGSAVITVALHTLEVVVERQVHQVQVVARAHRVLRRIRRVLHREQDLGVVLVEAGHVARAAGIGRRVGAEQGGVVGQERAAGVEDQRVRVQRGALEVAGDGVRLVGPRQVHLGQQVHRGPAGGAAGLRLDRGQVLQG